MKHGFVNRTVEMKDLRNATSSASDPVLLSLINIAEILEQDNSTVLIGMRSFRSHLWAIILYAISFVISYERKIKRWLRYCLSSYR